MYFLLNSSTFFLQKCLCFCLQYICNFNILLTMSLIWTTRPTATDRILLFSLWQRYTCMGFHHYHKGNRFCYFLYASLDSKGLPKGCLLFPITADIHLDVRQKWKTELPSLQVEPYNLRCNITKGTIWSESSCLEYKSGGGGWLL